jgi:hypothetical protein
MSRVLDARGPGGAGGPGPADGSGGSSIARTAWSVFAALAAAALFVQSWLVVQARPQDLVTGAHGMADIISRSLPPAFDQFVPNLWPVLETIDLAIFGTVFGVLLAFPLAILAAANVTPARPLYFASRALIGITRAVPDLCGRCCSSRLSDSDRFRGRLRSRSIRLACLGGCLPR